MLHFAKIRQNIELSPHCATKKIIQALPCAPTPMNKKHKAIVPRSANAIALQDAKYDNNAII